jgi:glycerol-3-phosphate dehydrogenase
MAADAVDAAIGAFDLTPGPVPQVEVGGEGTGADLDPAVGPGKCQTLRARLTGAHGWNVEGGLGAALSREHSVPVDVADHLAANYGDRAWAILAAAKTRPADLDRLSAQFPFVVAEIRHAARHEFARTAADVVSRRTRLAFLDAREALNSLPVIVDVMGDELGWGVDRKDREWKATVQFLVSMGLPSELQSMTRTQVLAGGVGKPAGKGGPSSWGQAGRTPSQAVGDVSLAGTVSDDAKEDGL